MGRRTDPGRRQRRQERRREEILAAAAGVFAAKGYHNATTREVAEAADLAEGTIFNYFASKRELLLALFAESAEDMLASVPQIGLDLPVDEALTRRLETVLAYYATNHLFIRAVIAEAWTDPDLLQSHALPRLQRAAGSLREYLQAQIAAGRLRPIDPELTTRLMLGMMAALVLPIARGVQPPPGPEERRRLAERVVDLILHGAAARGEG